MASHIWSIAVLKEGEPVVLFTVTTDEMVSSDLDGDRSNSLILVARQYHRHPQTHEQDHRDLAIGAFMAYAAESLCDCDDAHIEEVRALPPSEPIHFVGGSTETGLVPIWEQASESW